MKTANNIKRWHNNDINAVINEIAFTQNMYLKYPQISIYQSVMYYAAKYCVQAKGKYITCHAGPRSLSAKRMGVGDRK